MSDRPSISRREALAAAGIVAAHGGSVRAANASGGGASFVVRLPLAG